MLNLKIVHKYNFNDIKEHIEYFKMFYIAILLSVPLTISIHEFGHFFLDTIQNGFIRGYFGLTNEGFAYILPAKDTANQWTLLGGFLFVYILGMSLLIAFLEQWRKTKNYNKFLLGFMGFPFALTFVQLFLSPFVTTDDLYKMVELGNSVGSMTGIAEHTSHIMVFLMMFAIIISIFCLLATIYIPKPTKKEKEK